MNRFGLVMASAITALLATLGYSGGALAADGDTDTFSFTGMSTTVTSATYTFVSSTCAGVSSDESLTTCTLSSSGSYSFLVCGTGQMTGSLTVVEADGALDTVNYVAQSIAGVTVVTGAGISGTFSVVPTGTTPPPGFCFTSFDIAGTLQLM